MITQIKGRLIEKSPTEVIIDCNGIGYSVNISLNTFSKIGNDENIKLFTYLIIKEDSHSLYGFFDKSERSLFKLLISFLPLILELCFDICIYSSVHPRNVTTDNSWLKFSNMDLDF